MIQKVSKEAHKAILALLDEERGVNRQQRVNDRHIRSRVLNDFISGFPPITLG